jgi:ABC-type oligopeptide transport system ATPase subunit
MLHRKGFIRAVNSVDLELFPCETLGLVGQSGSGKTALARCALRLLEPTAGSVYFDGRDLLALPGEGLRIKRRQFQVIFQDPA